jgi:aspartyl protease family protein
MSLGNALVMAGLAVVGVAMLSPSLKNGARSPSQATVPLAVSASPVKRAESGGVGNGLAHRVLPRGPDGHFYADAQVNGATVRFLVDTGATVVVLTPADAHKRRPHGAALAFRDSVRVAAEQARSHCTDRRLPPAR